MAIQTIKATMQMRYGLEEDLEPDQLTTGEWAVSIDTKYVRMCFRPGLVLRMATYEAFEQDMVEIQTILATCRDIQAAVERFEQLAEQHKNDAASSALLSESWAHGETGIREGESEDNSKYWSEQSKSEADRAREEADRAEAIVGLEIDSSLNETSINPVQNKVVTEALNKKLNKDSVINNLSTTQAGKGALDAYQGKVTKDLYDTLAMDVDELNKNLMPVVLFHNESVDVTHTVRLNQSAANFKRIEILYKTNVGDYSMTPDDVNYHSTTVYNPNGKRVSLFSTIIPDNTKEVYLGFKEVDINGAEIKTHKTSFYHTGKIGVGKTNNLSNTDVLGIATVLGFYV